jgi:sugar lactone lactonase YvrE
MWLLLACTATIQEDSRSEGESSSIEHVEVTLTPTQSAAVELRWTTSEPTRGWVEYGETEELGRKSPVETEPRTDHAILLVGIPYGKTWSLRVAWEENDEVLVSDLMTYRAPDRATRGKVTLKKGSPDLPGFFLVPLSTGGLIVDRAGRVVWESQDTRQEGTHSQIRLVGNVVYRLIFDRSESGLDRIVGADLSGNLIEEISVPGAHHDFLFRDGDLYYLDRDIRPGTDGKMWVGDKLVRRTPDGTETTIWNSWDIPLNEGPADSSFYDAGLDLTHSNGLSWSEEHQLFLISSKVQNCVWAIDEEGKALWSVGNSPGALQVTTGDWVGTPHGPLLDGDRLYLFDNEPVDGGSSRAVVYQMDQEAGTLQQVWSHTDGQIHNVLGNVAPSPDGNFFVFYGQSGGIAEVDVDGTVRSALSTPPSGYMHALDNLGGPLPE